MGEVAEIRSGRDYKHLNKGNIPVYGTGGSMLCVDEALSYNVDAIGIGRKGTIDKPFLLKAPFWTVDTLFYVIPSSNYDLYFINNIFQTVNWKMYDESTGVPSLSKTAISKVTVLTPKLIEQVKLGNFFKQLDQILSLHQQKLDQLELMKKGFLQQLFPENGEKIPKVRFANFEDEWEQRKLASDLIKNKNKNKELKILNVESVSNKTGFTKQTDQFEGYTVASSDISNYYIIKEKQFAYNPSRINVGSIAYKFLEKITQLYPPFTFHSQQIVI